MSEKPIEVKQSSDIVATVLKIGTVTFRLEFRKSKLELSKLAFNEFPSPDDPSPGTVTDFVHSKLLPARM